MYRERRTDHLWGRLKTLPVPWQHVFYAGPRSSQARAHELLLRGAQLSAYLYILLRLSGPNSKGKVQVSEEEIAEATGYSQQAASKALRHLIGRNIIWVIHGGRWHTKTYMLGGGFRYVNGQSNNRPRLIDAMQALGMNWFNVLFTPLENLKRLRGAPLALLFALVRIAYERDAVSFGVDVADLKNRLRDTNPNSRFKRAPSIAGALKTLRKIVDADRTDGGQRLRISFLNPNNGDTLADAQDDREVERLGKREFKLNSPEDAARIAKMFPRLFPIKGVRRDGQFYMDCDWCQSRDSLLLTASKGKYGSFYCARCDDGRGLGGSVVKLVARINKISADEALTRTINLKEEANQDLK